WCALSSVWGGDQPMKATKATMKDLEEGLPASRFPRTIQDAATVALSVGIPYMWIDSLCIIQDDPNDLALQLGDMPNIYHHALVTITASSARSVHKSFLHDRGHSYSTLPPVALRYKSSHGSDGRILFLEPQIQTDQREDFSEPIDERGWTYQERLLSPRALIYTRKQLIWSCETLDRIAGDPRPDEQSGDNTGWEDRLSGDLESIQEDSHIDGVLEGSREAVQHTWGQWAAIVEAYTARNLSNPDDKLPAISALARTYHARFSLTYLAGLWKE
ncbi:HET-domain-containing protein, partial [Rhizodiscina lignyota]